MKNDKKLKVVFCTYPSIYSDIVLYRLMSSNNIEIVGVINSTKVFYKDRGVIASFFRLLRMVGYKYLSYQIVVTFVYSISSILSSSDVFFKKKYQLLKNVKFLKCRNVNDTIGIRFAEKLQADFLISAHFNQIIQQELLLHFRYGGLNIHPSLLPKYKGIDPNFYSLLRKEVQLGVTLHIISLDIDGGDIVAQRSFARKNNSLYLNNITSFKKGVDILIDVLNEFVQSNKMTCIKQDSNGVYDSWPSSDVVNQFLKENTLLGGWRLDIMNHVD